MISRGGLHRVVRSLNRAIYGVATHFLLWISLTQMLSHLRASHRQLCWLLYQSSHMISELRDVCLDHSFTALLQLAHNTIGTTAVFPITSL